MNPTPCQKKQAFNVEKVRCLSITGNLANASEIDSGAQAGNWPVLFLDVTGFEPVTSTV